MRYISDTDLDEFISDIRELIDKRSQGALLNILIDIHPADIASILNALRKEERQYLFGMLPPETAGAVIAEMDAPLTEQLLADIPETKISDIVDQMDSDDAADLISDLPEDIAEKVLEQIPDEVSEDVKELLLYGEDTAGGIMALEYLAVASDKTVKEAIREIRHAKDKFSVIHTVWVVDAHNVLVGDVSLTDLVLARPKDPITTVMNTEVKSVETGMDQEEIAMMFRKYDLVAVPVVNTRRQLVGQITVDDIVDVLDEEAAEDMSLFAGANDEEMLEESFLKISWFRLPWLLVAFVGQIVAALVIQRFETTLTHIIALTFFMPVIMAMGGNSGIQSSIIVIRGLATGEISMGNTWRRFFRELRVSVFIGFIFACLMTGVVGIWLENYLMGLMVGLALNVVIIQASIFGGLIPFILKRMEVDPALASGPFITTFNDILGLLIYLMIITTSIPLYM